MQLGTRLTNALVLRNPVDTRPAPLAYPSVTEGYRLACIGRFFMLDKGQDLLIQVLDRPVWRQRDLQVTFIGKGENRQSLLDLIRFYALDNVVVRDHVENGPDIWSDYHALILPSRFEGLPLVLLEAMAAGRTAIVTHAGGSDEIMEHGIHGFIAQPTVEDLEKAMEQAWQRRNEWAQMGAACFEQVNALYAVPAELELLNVINEQLNG
jgi:glycosyltransferase involved in cell wall biosynthesis